MILVRQFSVFDHNLLRKFPINGPLINPQPMPFMNQKMPNNMNLIPNISQMDQATRRDFYGEALFNKISINPGLSKFQEYLIYLI